MKIQQFLIGAAVLSSMLAVPVLPAFASGINANYGSNGYGWMYNGGYGMMGGSGYGMMGGYFSGAAASEQSSASQATVKGPYQVVKVVASDWKWSLSKKHLKFGEPIKFVVSSTEGTHGFSISHTNISKVISVGEKTQTVVWKPRAKGTYQIVCDVYCGPGHDSMVSTFTVS